jgi:hypothetical protein
MAGRPEYSLSIAFQAVPTGVPNHEEAFRRGYGGNSGGLLGLANRNLWNVADHTLGFRINKWTLNKSDPRNVGPDWKGKRPWRKVIPPERCTTAV